MDWMVVLIQAAVGKLYRVYVENFGVLLLGFAITFSVLVACLLAECLALGWKESSLRRLTRHPSKSAVIDVVSFLMVQWSLDPLLYAAMSLGLIPLLKSGLPQLIPLRLDLTFLAAPLQLLAYLLLVDLLVYWVHRMHHEVPFLWRLHKMHHSATEFNMLTVTRDHPLERGFNQLFVYLPMAFVNVESQLPLWLGGALSAYGMFKHSMVPWNWGWVGKYLLQAPLHHRIHHSYLPEHHDKNYGNLLGCWDHLFGTFYQGTTVNTAIGVTDDVERELNYAGRVWRHFYDFGRELVQGRVRDSVADQPSAEPGASRRAA